MKKFFFMLGLGLMSIMTLHAQGQGSLTVYQNGTLGKGITPYPWYNWNQEEAFTAPDPSVEIGDETGGTGQCFKFEASGNEGYKNASMGLLLDNENVNTGFLCEATLNFNWYAVGTGKYSIRLTAGEGLEEDYVLSTEGKTGRWQQNTSIKINEAFPKVSKWWNENINNGVGYVFSIILTDGSEGDAIYFQNIQYTKANFDWTPAESTVPAPTTVPVPSQKATDVLSIFSSSYDPATTFNMGYWGQTTGMIEKTIDSKEVEYLTNFNYLGWELNSDIDVSEYDYMHVDFWTANTTGFGFTPVTRQGSATEKSIVMNNVKLNEWNRYDIALSEWKDAGMDLSTVFQIKFDQGSSVDCYLTNVYFWKGELGNEGGNDNPGTGDDDNAGITYKGTMNGTHSQTMDGVTTEYPYTLDYTIIYNEDKTLTLTGTYEWANNQEPVGATNNLIMVIPGVWASADGLMQGQNATTDKTFEAGEEITINFATAVANGNVNTEVKYIVGSKTEGGNTDGIANVETSDKVDIYSISGVCVAKNVDFNEVKSSLVPGLYIVGGKKVLVK